MAGLNLPAQSLEYDDLRENLVNFLRGNPVYKDFNFEASGISTQMNILAYNSHMIGVYVKMLMDESFVDSAHTRSALLSHAKKTSYLPKGKRAARADLRMDILVDPLLEPKNAYVLIPSGTSFNSTNAIQDTRTFQILSDVIARRTTETVSGSIVYRTPVFTVFEGIKSKWRFKVDSSVVGQNFVVKDPNLDVDTIKVKVFSSETSTTFEEFKPARFSGSIDDSSKVYYTTTNENGLYQVFFGNNVFGLQPGNGNIVEVEYVSTSGELGNGAKTFLYNFPPPDLALDYHVGNFSDIVTNTISPSSGGMEAETIDSLKMSIPNHYRRQNRLLSESDYRSVILEEFRNVDSINVWGGEKHWRRDYGKVYCSIKPKNAQFLTNSAKAEIKEKILNVYGAVGSDIVFVDPEYIDVELQLVVKVDRRKTDKGFGDIQGEVSSRATLYNLEKLNSFGSDLNDIDLLNYSKGTGEEITSIFSNKKIKKKSPVIYRSTGTTRFTFSNSTVTNSLVSSKFSYGGKVCKFVEEYGLVYIYGPDNKKIMQESQGSIDHLTGIVEFKFPEYATVEGFSGQSGVLEFTAVPETPDIRTELNNIVRISSIEVVFR